MFKGGNNSCRSDLQREVQNTGLNGSTDDKAFKGAERIGIQDPQRGYRSPNSFDAQSIARISFLDAAQQTFAQVNF
jgi:hypothetical protein